MADWIDVVADAGGESRSEAREDIVASSWQLEEIADLLDASVEAPADRDPPTIEALLERVDRLTEALERVSGSTADGPDPAESADPRLGHLEGRVAFGATRRRDLEADLTGQLMALGDRLDALETAAVSQDAALTELTDAAVTDTDLDAFGRQTQESIASVDQRTAQRRERVNAEFHHLRTILEHLVDRTAATEAHLERAVETVEARLRSPAYPHCERLIIDGRTRRGPLGLFSSTLLEIV